MSNALKRLNEREKKLNVIQSPLDNTFHLRLLFIAYAV